MGDNSFGQRGDISHIEHSSHFLYRSLVSTFPSPCAVEHRSLLSSSSDKTKSLQTPKLSMADSRNRLPSRAMFRQVIRAAASRTYTSINQPSSASLPLAGTLHQRPPGSNLPGTPHDAGQRRQDLMRHAETQLHPIIRKRKFDATEEAEDPLSILQEQRKKLLKLCEQSNRLKIVEYNTRKVENPSLKLPRPQLKTVPLPPSMSEESSGKKSRQIDGLLSQKVASSQDITLEWTTSQNAIGKIPTSGESRICPFRHILPDTLDQAQYANELHEKSRFYFQLKRHLTKFVLKRADSATSLRQNISS